MEGTDVLEETRAPSAPVYSSRRERRAAESADRAESLARLRIAHRTAPAPKTATSVVPAPKASAKPRPRHHAGFRALVVLTLVGLAATVSLPSYALTAQGGAQDATAQLASAQHLGVVGGSAVGTITEGFTSKKPIVVYNETITVPPVTAPVTADAQKLAKHLMQAVAEGRLSGGVPDHIKEIRWIAEGVAVPNCGVDFRVLQTIDVALQVFKHVAVSDINRLCTGQLEGAGTASWHYKDGGGHAVDFYLLDGHSLTGRDPQSLKLIAALDTVVPKDSDVGQQGCGPLPLKLVNLHEFPDSCTHLHIDFGVAEGSSLLNRSND